MNKKLYALIAVLFCIVAPAAERMNVLFIAVDDLRPELGCYGQKQIISPNIDTLAQRGIRFDRAYCQQAVCNPSRASLLTGLRPDTTRVWDLVTHFRKNVPDVITLPQYFKENGYTTVGMGKIFHNNLPDDQSWSVPKPAPKPTLPYSQATLDKMREEREKARAAGMTPDQISNRIRGPATEIEDIPDDKRFDGALTTLAVEQLQGLSKADKPFFMAVGYSLPHLPFTPPKRYWDMYDRSKIAVADNQFIPRQAPAVAFGDRAWGGTYELRDTMTLCNMPSPFVGSLDEAEQRLLKHGYYASVTFIDAQIGRLMAELERLQLTDKTIIVLWGDHGWKLGEHNGWCKQTNYEIDTRAPLIFCAPHVATEGTDSPALVEFIDIYPSLCDLAGLPKPDHVQGRSLLPLIKDPKHAWPHVAYSQFPRSQEGVQYMGYTIRTDRYRYVVWLEQSSHRVSAEELYDHQYDPNENQNIAQDPQNASIMKALSEQMATELGYKIEEKKAP